MRQGFPGEQAGQGGYAGAPDPPVQGFGAAPEGTEGSPGGGLIGDGSTTPVKADMLQHESSFDVPNPPDGGFLNG